MTVTYIISIILNIITVIVVFKLCSKYTKLYEESSQDRVFLVTLVEYVLHMKAHTDNETVNNDMVNAVKTCVNKGYYEIKPVDGVCSDSEAYENFAEQVFEFIYTIDKE